MRDEDFHFHFIDSLGIIYEERPFKHDLMVQKSLFKNANSSCVFELEKNTVKLTIMLCKTTWLG